MGAVMENLVDAGKADSLKSGEMTRMSVQGREILIVRVGEEYFAADNRCPHAGGDLSHGRLEGTIVTCPRHKSQFDLRDGRVIRWTVWPGVVVAVDQFRSRRRNLKVYPVTIQNGRIMLKL